MVINAIKKTRPGYNKIENDGGGGGDAFRSGDQARPFKGMVFEL